MCDTEKDDIALLVGEIISVDVERDGRKTGRDKVVRIIRMRKNVITSGTRTMTSNEMCLIRKQITRVGEMLHFDRTETRRTTSVNTVIEDLGDTKSISIGKSATQRERKLTTSEEFTIEPRGTTPLGTTDDVSARTYITNIDRHIVIAIVGMSRIVVRIGREDVGIDGRDRRGKDWRKNTRKRGKVIINSAIGEIMIDIGYGRRRISGSCCRWRILTRGTLLRGRSRYTSSLFGACHDELRKEEETRKKEENECEKETREVTDIVHVQQQYTHVEGSTYNREATVTRKQR